MPLFNAHGGMMHTPPKQTEIVRNLIPLKFSDKDGDATLEPQDDMTIMECWKITQMVFYCVTQPPPMQDKRTGEVVTSITPWRQYITDNQLDRHFSFQLSVRLDG